MPKRPPNSDLPSARTASARCAGRPGLLARILIEVVDGYRVLVAPLLPRSCRFVPSCSEFAREALAEHGAGRGALLAALRLVRCHPWHPGGYDPVPPGRERGPVISQLTCPH
jgi:hypothetical protein